MNNEELIKALRCEVDCGDCAYYTDRCDEWGMRCDAADALEAAEQRINELTTKCNQLQAEVDNYEQRIKELESQAAFFDAEKLNYQENIVYRDELIKGLEAQLPKEGEWVAEPMTREKFYNDPYLSAKCSICGANSREIGHYCPNCGAKLRGEHE